MSEGFNLMFLKRLAGRLIQCLPQKKKKTKSICLCVFFTWVNTWEIWTSKKAFNSLVRDKLQILEMTTFPLFMPLFPFPQASFISAFHLLSMVMEKWINCPSEIWILVMVLDNKCLILDSVSLYLFPYSKKVFKKLLNYYTFKFTILSKILV